MILDIRREERAEKTRKVCFKKFDAIDEFVRSDYFM